MHNTIAMILLKSKLAFKVLIYLFNNNEIQYVNPPNNFRLKRYLRMDGSIIYNFGSTDNLSGFVAFSLQNIGNKINILGRTYIQDNMSGSSSPRLIEINERGLQFTPNISVNIRMH